MPFTSGIGITELLIVLAIVLVVFGPKRLPALGKQLGGGIREFRQSLNKRGGDDDDDDDDDDRRAALPSSESGAAEQPAADGEVVSERR